MYKTIHMKGIIGFQSKLRSVAHIKYTLLYMIVHRISHLPTG